jgi:hypothetical protein
MAIFLSHLGLERKLAHFKARSEQVHTIGKRDTASSGTFTSSENDGLDSTINLGK